MAMFPVLLVMVLLSALLSAVFVAAWATMSRPRHALTWAACFACGGAQWSVNLASAMSGGPLPGGWAVSTVCVMGLILFALAGYRQRSGLPVRARAMMAVAAVIFAGSALFRLGWPHTGLFLALIPALGTVAMPLIVHAICARPGPRSPGEKVAIATAVILTLFELILLVLALRVGASRANAAYETYITVLTAGLPTLYIGMGISGLFLLMADQTAALDRLARHDPLTGLLNRRGFRDAVELRLEQPGGGCVVVADIDHFKRINDAHGHAAGDLALCRVAEALRLGAHPDVVLGRIGGEEFALFVPGFALERAEPFVERLRAQIANVALPGYSGSGVTMSFGIAPRRRNDEGLDLLLRRADEALYRAKTAGRDRVVAALNERTARFGASLLEAARARLN